VKKSGLNGKSDDDSLEKFLETEEEMVYEVIW